jgi:hypothetical protein
MRIIEMHLLAVAYLFLIATPPRAGERLNVAPHGTFEEHVEGFSGWIPVGVVPDGVQPARIVDEVAHAGTKSLRIDSGPAGLVTGTIQYADYNGGEGKRAARADDGVRGVRTFALRLDPAATALEASVWVCHTTGDSISLTAVWTTRRNRKPVVELRRDTTAEAKSADDDWQRINLRAERPPAASQVQLWIETDGLAPFHVDDVEMRFAYTRHTQLLVDQLGYESASRSKVAVLQTTEPMGRLSAARVVDESSGRVVWKGGWTDHGGLSAWDRYHQTVDFSDFAQPGRYKVVVDSESGPISSPPFEVADELVVGATAELAHRFYYYQRCGMEVPGFHAACHLDDAKLADGTFRDLTGGWHDAGDYNKYNGLTPEAVYALAWAYHQRRDLYASGDRDGNRVPDILDEASWGARFVEKMIDLDTLELLESVSSGYRYWGPPEAESDNLPGTGDERPVRPGRGDPTYCAAAFALLGKALTDTAEPDAVSYGERLVELAERMFERHGGGMMTLVALLEATGNKRYRDLARENAKSLLDAQPADGVSGFRELAQFAESFKDDALVSKIRSLAQRRVASLATTCDDRFGVACRQGADGTLIYCRAYDDVNDWYVGETSLRLDAAIDALWASRLGAVDAHKIAEDQVHWLLGRNPFGICYMEGVGTTHLLSYHHRYNAIPGNPRGAVSGALVNGMIRAWPGVDRPWLDLLDEPNADYHSNEPWLLHNNRWLMLIALW